MRISNLLLVAIALFLVSCNTGQRKKDRSGPRMIEILFLGHASEHHPSGQYAPVLASALAKEGIQITYTEDVNDLNPENLSLYDGLIIYANHDSITADQEEALFDFVSEGKGFIPIHSASYCFRNSDKYVELVGGQFLKHETGEFTADIVDNEHPVMQSVEAFSTWDETYVHDKLTGDRTVVMERIEGNHREPWTWVKSHGNGRVFYTAYGHDDRTWNKPEFHNLVKQGILWAVGDQVRSQWDAFHATLPALVYREEPNIPNYEKREPNPQYQEPLSPEESKKLIQVRPGFSLELFASEPDIINPISMEWDERGRLWVIETVDYPNTVLEGDKVGDDRIKICEDTDGDGRADKFTVFADELNIPTSLVFHNGGVIISQAPYFLYLKDTDGDDKADVKRVLIEGWGTFDTHAGPSNLRYGFDNRIWGSVGYSGFKGTVGGDYMEFTQGFYRFAPDASSFEYLTHTSNNTWGLGLTENNDVFGSTANNTHSVFMGITDREARGAKGITVAGSAKIDGHYAMHPITDKVRQVDVFGGFTAASGHHFYTAKSYPEEFHDGKIAFVCEPTGHLIHMARMEKDGAGFKEKDEWNLFAGADEWVAPVEAKVGPDGAVWVLDWYNFIIQHNPTPTAARGGYDAVNGKGNAYENPLRDKSRGRVWRVVYDEAPEYKPVRLGKDDPDALIEGLKHDNMFWRMTSQRLLVERGSNDVVPGLLNLIRSGDDNPYATIHALWTLQGLNIIQRDEEANEIVNSALRHSHAGVRKAAIQILSEVQWQEDVVLGAEILEDSDPNTLLAAVLSLTRVPNSPVLGEKLYQLSKKEEVAGDRWLSQAVYVAAGHHAQGFLEAHAKDNPSFRIVPDRQISGQEKFEFDDSPWKTMELPQYIERAGLNIDGIIWFRTAIDVPAKNASAKALISLGPVDDSDETWINGVKVGGMQKVHDKSRVYEVPAGILRAGRNVVAVKVEDNGGGGGIYGSGEQMFLQAGGEKISLAGVWKFDVEKEFNSRGSNPFEKVSIADVFVTHYSTDAGSEGSDATVEKSGAQITIKSIQNEMKYDLKTFTVEAGKQVTILFINPDFMQHNLVVTVPGALEKVGKAADKLAADPRGAEMQYVPDLPEVLFHTDLVNPQKSATLEFIAPLEPGEYPFVCTFPGHWSIMNGVMKVVKSKPSI